MIEDHELIDNFLRSENLIARTMRELIAERDALREALKPFAEEAEAWGNHVKDNRAYYVPEDCEACFTFGDLRRARDALK